MALTRISGALFANNTLTGNNIAANTINTNNFVAGISLAARGLTLSYPTGTSANTQGGQTITMTGSGFTNGSAVYIDKTAASVVSVANSTSLSFTSPAKSAGRYIVYIIAPDGTTSIFASGILYA